MSTAFTSYAFPATGAPTSRTLPARLADRKNVKDFGAVGNGVTDDLAAIQAAFNWTVNTNRGWLYFPPGTYLVSGPIDISGSSVSARLSGEMGRSTIVGNFADYVIKRAAPGQTAAQAGGHFIERLTIINQHASGGGVRFGANVGSVIRDCDITANLGINNDNGDTTVGGAYWYTLEQTIINCRLRAYNALATNSVGLSRGANGPTISCQFYDYDRGIITYGGQGGMLFAGCYFEHNNVGIANGWAPNQSSPNTTGTSVGACSVVGCYFKNNKIGIGYKIGISRFSGILIEATEGTITGNPQYGIFLPLNGASYCLFAGVKVVGQYQVAGISIAGGEAARATSQFKGVRSINTSTLGGVNWILPSSAFTSWFKECNVAPVFTMAALPAKTLNITSATWSGGLATIVTQFGHNLSNSFVNINVSGVTPSGYNGTFAGATVVDFHTFRYAVADPGGSGSVFGTVFFTGTAPSTGITSAIEGETYNVSDSNTAVWGAAALGGGSNHAKLRFTPQAWTVMGK